MEEHLAILYLRKWWNIMGAAGACFLFESIYLYELINPFHSFFDPQVGNRMATEGIKIIIAFFISIFLLVSQFLIGCEKLDFNCALRPFSNKKLNIISII